MRFIRSKSKCATCPLRDQARCWSEGPDGGSPILILGEAPGQHEDNVGRCFVGPSGRILNWGLNEAGIYRAGAWVSNVISCRPPENQFDSPEGREAQDLCRPGFEEELAFLKERGLRVILALGANACLGLGLTGSMGKIRGSVYKAHGVLVLPTYHPAFILRSRYQKAGSSVDLTATWIADLKKAKLMAQDGWQEPKENFELSPTLERLTEFVDGVIKKKSLVAVDIETTGFDPGRSEVVVVGFADTAEHALSVPFLKKGGLAYWKNGDYQKARSEVIRLFQNADLMFQNALFDVPFLRAKGFPVPYENIKHDTLLLHHAISPELPHNLGFIVSVYGATPYWKADFLSRLGSILEMDDVSLRTYNLRDCVVLHQVLPPLVDDLRESGTEGTYTNESLPLLEPVGSMKERGILLDADRLASYRRKLSKDLQAIDAGLRDQGRLPGGFNLDSGEDLRWFLFGIAPAKFKRLSELEPGINPKTGKAKRPLRTDTKKYKELQELLQVRDGTKPLVDLRGFRGRTTDTGLASTNEQGLLSLQLHLQNRLEAIGRLVRREDAHEREAVGIRALLEWLTQFYEYRRIGKLYSTYTDYKTWTDGAVHPGYAIHGTATGRLSCYS